MRAKTTVLVYACDFSQKGSLLGDETIRRLEGLKTFNNLDQTILILTAGFSPQPFKYQNQTESFAKMMKSWVLGNIDIQRQNIYADVEDGVWGTVAETHKAIQLIKKHDLPKYVIFITSKYHKNRVAFIWRMLAPSDWKVSGISVDYPPPVWFIEKAKTFWALLKILKIWITK